MNTMVRLGARSLALCAAGLLLVGLAACATSGPSTGGSQKEWSRPETGSGRNNPPTVASGGLLVSLPPVPDRLGISVRPIPDLPADFIRGADVSMIAQIEAMGGRFRRDDGRIGDPFAILRDHGVNWIRLRLWNHPYLTTATVIDGIAYPAGTAVGGGNDDLRTVIGLARQAKALGLKVLLDFHYSDFWADPRHQRTPAAWAGLAAPQLERALAEYTAKVLREMRAAGAAPDMVQIGNEINNGMLWPVGRVTPGPRGYNELIRLLDSAARAVREADPGAKIMIHIADNGTEAVEAFFDAVSPHVDFDLIGLSYYPYWQGTIAELKATLDAVAARYDKPVVIAETAYAYTDRNADRTPNSFSGTDPSVGGFPVSVEGQATEIRDVMAALAEVPDHRGLGLFYWEPDWIPVKGAGVMIGEGDVWENQAWWDFRGRPLASMWTYRLVSQPSP